MIVYDLRCANGHDFEGWFADSEAFAAQGRAGQLQCPFCETSRVDRQVSPLRIGGAVPAASTEPPVPTDSVGERLRTLAKLQRRMLETSTWVGGRFAERARAMADGDEPQATIYGQATIAEAKALHEDGVAVMPLPFAVVPPDKQN